MTLSQPFTSIIQNFNQFSVLGGGSGDHEVSAQAQYDAFWPRQIEDIRNMDLSALKRQELPLARIKKVQGDN